MLLRTGASLLAAVAVCVFVVIAGYDLQTSVIVIIVGIGMVLMMISEIARAALYGLQSMPATAVADVLVKVVSVVVVVGLLVLGAGTEPLAMASVVRRRSAPATCSGGRCGSASPASATGSTTPGSSVLRRSSPYLLGSVVTVVYGSLDVVMISLMASADEIGWYAAAATLLGSLLFIPSTIMTSLFPAVAKVHEETPEAVPGMLSKAIRSSWLMSVPIGLGTIVVAAPVARDRVRRQLPRDRSGARRRTAS